MSDDMDAMMADGLLHTVRECARRLYKENQTYPCDDVKRMAAENERLRAALEAWRDAARFNITMEGAQYTGVEHSRALKAWEKTRAALEEKP